MFQFFASYGSYALDEEDSNSPFQVITFDHFSRSFCAHLFLSLLFGNFQSLLFLIRDWQNDDDYGMEAGRQLLDDTFKVRFDCGVSKRNAMQVHASSNASMQSLRKDIQRCYYWFICFEIQTRITKWLIPCFFVPTFSECKR